MPSKSITTKYTVATTVLFGCMFAGSETFAQSPTLQPANSTVFSGRPIQFPLMDSASKVPAKAPTIPNAAQLELSFQSLPPLPNPGAVPSAQDPAALQGRSPFQNLSGIQEPLTFQDLPKFQDLPQLQTPPVVPVAKKQFDFTNDFAQAYQKIGTAPPVSNPPESSPLRNQFGPQHSPESVSAHKNETVVDATELPSLAPTVPAVPPINDRIARRTDADAAADDFSHHRDESGEQGAKSGLQSDKSSDAPVAVELDEVVKSTPNAIAATPVNQFDPATWNADPLWWKQVVNQALNPDNKTQTIDTNTLVLEALKNSPRIQAISQTPLIRELQVIEADSDFDPVSFVRSNFEDRNDPVGNTLTTGGAPFLKDNIWSGEFGLRKKTRTGASVQMSERLGFKNSNSTFFLPQDQGTATLALNVTQPLMRGRGKYYNQSQILIAQATGGAAWNTFSNELQDELQEITQAYWRLYYDRSLYLQMKRNVERGEQILLMLEGRSELDSLPSQIARARSAVQSRKTDLANAFRDVRNAETEIRRRIADREWLAAQSIELLPVELPQAEPFEIPLEQVVLTALEQRLEIKEVLQRAKIAGIQRDVSTNELLPELSLLMGTYVSALKGESALGQAITGQFGVAPGYNFGVQFEMPYQNRSARSRLAQQKLQVAKIKAEVDETIQKVVAESQISLRRVNSAGQTLLAAEQAIIASRADLQQNYQRWEAFGLVEGDLADGQNPTTLLNQVLDSQERLAAAELIYAQAELDLKNSETALQRTMGTLLMHENIDFSMLTSGDQPEMKLEKKED